MAALFLSNGSATSHTMSVTGNIKTRRSIPVNQEIIVRKRFIGLISKL
jgi:hypothetical protein